MINCQWRDEDDVDAKCQNIATHNSCKPYGGAQTCEEHKCRCAKKIVNTAEIIKETKEWNDHFNKKIAKLESFQSEITANTQRLSWERVWMNVAKAIATGRSSDPRLKVGALIVSEDNTSVLAVGYNGGVSGLSNEPESLEPGKSGFLHAELNCLLKAPYHYHMKKIMYVTHSPCVECSRAIANSNISRVVYETHYRDVSGLEILKKVGIQIEQLV